MALTAAVLVQAIHSIKCELMSNSQWFALEIVAEAGTYIKEFCHGDFGRTQPNVGSLLGRLEVQIAELDVVQKGGMCCSHHAMCMNQQRSQSGNQEGNRQPEPTSMLV
jgi:hypothetical protein